MTLCKLNEMVVRNYTTFFECLGTPVCIDTRRLVGKYNSRGYVFMYIQVNCFACVRLEVQERSWMHC